MAFKIDNLIRGKIAELVFDQMFRQSGQFTIIPFGYESTLPEIAQNAALVEFQPVLDQIRTAPDFALVSHDKTQVYLVEVKYMHRLNEQRVLDMATKIHKQWKVVWLFIATPTGFYFDSCAAIIANSGKVKTMDAGWVAKEVQGEIIVTLRKFI